MDKSFTHFMIFHMPRVSRHGETAINMADMGMSNLVLVYTQYPHLILSVFF
jgi:hypothetical protein